MPIPQWFDQLTLDEAASLVADATPDWIATNRKFMEGDHWQDGDGWIGPKPNQSEQGFDKTMDLLEGTFTSRNAIREVTERHAHAVVGREIAWDLVLREPPGEEEELSDDQEELLEEAREDLRWWWQERDMDQVVEDLVEAALWGGRGPLRVFVPRGLLQEDDDDGTVEIPEGDFRDQLERLYVDQPDHDAAHLYEDADTRRELGIVVYELTEGNPATAAGVDRERAELSWVEDDGTTVIRIVQTLQSGETDQEDVARLEWDFGGRLPLLQLERTPLITEQVRQAQRALNLADSMIPRNVTTGGFLERVLLNAQLPGEWVQDDDTGMQRFKPEPMEWGAGVVNRLVGIQETDEEGNTTFKSPSIEYRDPVPVDPSEDAKMSHYRDILGETDQLHVMIQDDATASGTSREQARADFERSTGKTKKPVDVLVADLLETVLAMAGAFAEDRRFIDNLRVTCDCELHLGPISPEQQQANRALVKANLLSRESAMTANGVEDVEAERAKIQEQEGSQLALRQEQAEVMNRLVQAGADILSAARAAGFSEEEAEDLFGEAAEAQVRQRAQSLTERDRIRAALSRGLDGENGAGAGAPAPGGGQGADAGE